MGITYGDHLIDSGYYDITPEQEREIEASEAKWTAAQHEAAIKALTGATGDFECENCIGMPEHGCYCAAMGGAAPGGRP